jgi:conserved oligomeric Golgi complex subunit 4
MSQVARRDPRTLTSLPDVLSTLSSLQSEEAELSNSLGQLLADREPVNTSLSRLDALVSRIEHLHGDANSLAGRVSGTALTAERVGGKVRSLDEEMRRIREAADQVAQVVDLKSSLTSLQAAMEEQDWEGAARHCARAMALPSQVIEGKFAETTIVSQLCNWELE